MKRKSAPRDGRRNESLKDEIEQEIIQGKIRPGQRLDEQALAARYGVSRTPIREALLQLSAIGWVELRHRRSAVVTSISMRQLMAMWEVASTLEALCARLCARRMLAEEQQQLTAILDAAEPLVAHHDDAAYELADRRFHDAIHAGAKNEYLKIQCEQVIRRMYAHRPFPFRQPGRMEVSLKEHRAIVDAIVAGDAQQAEEAMQVHASRGGRDFFDVFAMMPRDEEPAHDEPEVTSRRVPAVAANGRQRS